MIPLQTSPFLLNLNLNPLYSSLGGSVTLAEPLIKKTDRCTSSMEAFVKMKRP
jgi:hypothetical protein